GRIDREPLVQATPALGRQAVDGPPPPAGRPRFALDQPGVGEPAELGVDLAVAGRPEEADRAIDEGLDLVARLRPEGEKPEDDVGGRRELHISAWYITSIYMFV